MLCIGVQIHSFACEHLAAQLIERLFLPHCIVLVPVLKSIDQKTRGLFLTLNSIPLNCMSVLKKGHDPHCCSLAVSFETGKHESYLFFFITTVQAIYSGSFAGPQGFQGQLVSFCQKGSGILNRHCIKFIDQLREYCHLDGIKFSNS